MKYLVFLLLALTSCATTRPDFYRAPRRAQRYYQKHQRQHEHERNRLRGSYPGLGW